MNNNILAASELSAHTRDEMFDLMKQYYHGMRREEFDADLAEKHWVIAVSDEQGKLCGFSTQRLLEAEVDSRKIRSLFSGDTIVDREHWARTPLAGLWGRLALALVDRYPTESLYWFLISKGYKTYRFLPLFFGEFYPRVNVTMPPRAQRVLNALAHSKFPVQFDQAGGIIRSRPDSCRLRDGVAEVTERHLADPHTRFFCERNPRHAQGDELCCLAPLSRENFTPAAWKVIKAAPVGPLPNSLEPLERLAS